MAIKGITKVNEKAAGRTLRRGVGRDTGKLAKENQKSFLNENKDLDGLLPFSTKFLGKSIQYTNPSARVKKKAEKLDIAHFRLDVGKFAVNSGICHSREVILKHLKSFPFHGDLHALNAILTFCDSVQLGNKGGGKIDLVKDALVEMAIAITNGADCVFNVTWFLKIYLYYLVALVSRHSRLQQAGQHFRDPKVSTAMSNLNKVRDQLKCLQIVKERSELHMKLQQSVKGTFYLVQGTTESEYKEACKALLANNEKQAIGRGKRANYILYIHHITLYVMAHIPIMRSYVEQEMARIPEVHRDLVLKKRMIVTAMKKLDFSLNFASNELRACREISVELYKYCLASIEEHLQNVVLIRDFEVDPFFCLAWIVTESNNIALDRTQYKGMLEKANECVKMVAGQHCRDDGHINSARIYQFSLNRLIDQYE